MSNTFSFSLKLSSETSLPGPQVEARRPAPTPCFKTILYIHTGFGPALKMSLFMAPDKNCHILPVMIDMAANMLKWHHIRHILSATTNVFSWTEASGPLSAEGSGRSVE
jgi:hypothetical protein